MSNIYEKLGLETPTAFPPAPEAAFVIGGLGDFALAKAILEQTHGKAFRLHPIAGQTFRAAFRKMAAAEERFHRDRLKPLEEAAHALARSPAPTIKAALFKLQLAQWEDLGIETQMDDQAFDLVEADFKRLAAQEAE